MKAVKKTCVEDLAEWLSNLVSPRMLSILFALDRHGELSTGTIAKLTKRTPENTSSALELLRRDGVVCVRRCMADARYRMYSIKCKEAQKLISFLKKKKG